MVYIIRVNFYGNLQYLSKHGWRRDKHFGRIKPMLFKASKVPACYSGKEYQAIAIKRT